MLGRTSYFWEGFHRPPVRFELWEPAARGSPTQHLRIKTGLVGSAEFGFFELCGSFVKKSRRGQKPNSALARAIPPGSIARLRTHCQNRRPSLPRGAACLYSLEALSSVQLSATRRSKVDSGLKRHTEI